MQTMLLKAVLTQKRASPVWARQMGRRASILSSQTPHPTARSPWLCTARMGSSLSLSDRIAAKAHHVVALKADKDTDAATIQTAVDELLCLKAQLAPPAEVEVFRIPEASRDWGPVVEYHDVQTNGDIEFGDYATIRSQDASIARQYTLAKDIGAAPSGGTPSAGALEGASASGLIWLRGRVASIRVKGNSAFVVIRSGTFYTVQACHFKDDNDIANSKALLKFVKDIALESIVDVCGIVVPAHVKSCTQQTAEIQIRKMFVVSRARTVLPFLLEDASRSQADIDSTAESDRPLTGVGQEVRLNNRWLDLRVPANNAMLRIRGGISMLFREALTNQGFCEINTPKLIGGESEGGSSAFRVDYFGQDACLAQSPQLYNKWQLLQILNAFLKSAQYFEQRKVILVGI